MLDAQREAFGGFREKTYEGCHRVDFPPLIKCGIPLVAR